MGRRLIDHPPSRSTSASASSSRTGFLPFPEPQLYRSISQERPKASPPGVNGHRPSRSDFGSASLRLHQDPSTASFASAVSSYYATEDNEYYSGEYGESDKDLSQELSSLSLDSEEGLRRFQTGDLPENDQDWHRLVPPEAIEALGKQEVQRQSVIFEVFKAEREYVADLEAVQEVFIEPLRNAKPPIIQSTSLPGFIAEVFGNLDQILAHHQRMLGALFSRQREQHPLVQSVADIILDTTLKSNFRSAYEVYIKHYPLAESHHRKELKRNHEYQVFMQSASADPRIRKRDLITFLSRPVTRLPRLNLLLEHILKLTDEEHPDLETLPIILEILKDCIKSTQPGIEAAEREIINMDLYYEGRTLVHSGPASRRTRTDAGWSAWSDLMVALLDNFLILTREEKRPNGIVKRFLISRPLPLSYLRLGSFDSPPEMRRERPDDGRILESLRYQNVPLYPFTIYHASNKSNRRYTLYVASEAIRKKWQSSLVDAIGVHKARQEGNMWFNVQSLSDNFFRMGVYKATYKPNVNLPGMVTSAVSFRSGSKRFIAVGCPTGIYVSLRGQENFRKVLPYGNPSSLAAIEGIGEKTFNKFIVHYDTSVFSYSLEIIARVALGQAQIGALEATMERIAGQDSNVLFCKHIQIGQRVLLIYTSKRTLHVTPTMHALEAVDISEMELTPRRTQGPPMRGFRVFGDPGYIPKDAYDVTPLIKTIGICTNDGIVIVDPTNQISQSSPIYTRLALIPHGLPQGRTDNAKPLGLARVDKSELLVIYDGCYITKHGAPSRQCGYMRWESPALSYVHRGDHILLFSAYFIEVRNITTGQIVQVIEADGIRLMFNPYMVKDENILVAMRGGKDDESGISDKIAELVETSEITTAAPVTVPAMWDDWDM
ncbi:hypothetical protein BD779DRAFT_1668158 [Infundibulicybe gibba]|nr:hypothetical protein BD779DRAFT_1668158 [Infundibulicybe gibba]